MRAYTAASLEAVRARDLLKDWASEGLLTETQRRQAEQETVCELRTTNIFLRFLQFVFTVLIVCAAAALFFVIFTMRPAGQTTGVLLLIFAGVSYGAAEAAVSQARLYHHGIEEALAVCSVGFLCAGIYSLLFGDVSYSPETSRPVSLVPIAGALASLWIWRRFTLIYAFFAAMLFLVWLTGCWTSAHSAQHVMVAVFYATGLITIAVARSPQRWTYLDDENSIIEALLWLGVYLAINIQLSSVNVLHLWEGGFLANGEFSRPFYWATWVLTWCVPVAILARGLRRKDRPVIAAGMITAILTLITNKPYLGWPRHTWDPMLMGIVLMGAAVFGRRWLAAGPGGIRRGFTAQSLSGKDKRRISAGTTVIGVVAPQSATLSPQVGNDFHFGGGDSGGGGASSDF